MSKASPYNLDDLPMSDALRKLAQRGEHLPWERGEILMREGETGGPLLIILRGRLRAFSVKSDDSRRITYGDYLAGEFLGEMSLDGGKRSASVRAMVPSVCSLVTETTVRQHIAEHPEFAFELLSKVIRRARAATLSLRAVALNDVYGRVVWFLNTRAVLQADGRCVVGPVTHRDMADALGCTRPMITKVLNALATGGYIAVAGHRITLLNALPARF